MTNFSEPIRIYVDPAAQKLCTMAKEHFEKSFCGTLAERYSNYLRGMVLISFAEYQIDRTEPERTIDVNPQMPRQQ